MRYRLSDIARLCGGEFYGTDAEVCEVVVDSRSHAFGSGAMFVAKSGTTYDAHDFIGDMLHRGVKAFMVERDVDFSSYEAVGVVKVENSLEALQRLAAAHRASFGGKVVGITGSYGKTIVKEWVASALPADVKFFASPMSYNSQLGVALSLLMMDGDEELALIEAGISEMGEMQRLEAMIRPDVVVFTSVGEAHQHNFESIEDKVAEKLILARNAKTLLYHSNYPIVEQVARKIALRCDRRDAAEDDKSISAYDATAVNMALVKSLCRELGYDSAVAAADVAMRMEVKEGIGHSTIVYDSYNSDINSLALAIDTLRNIALGGKTTAVIADVGGSGNNGGGGNGMSDAELYERVAALVAGANIDEVIGVGENISRYGSLFGCRSRFYDNEEALMRELNSADVAARTILLKGNRRDTLRRLCHRLESKSHTTVLEVNLDAMTHNLSYFRRFLPMNHRVVAMVKAHSYGAGDVEVAQLLQRQGVAYLAVAFADEGVVLREKGITMPILVLNADAESFDKMVAYNLEPEIYSFHSLTDFSRSVESYGRKEYPIHIKLDTGMHRLGFVEEELPQLIEWLSADESVRVASVFAHLSCADMPSEDDFTRRQIALFDRLSGELQAALPYTIIRHTANSAAIERFPEAHFDMCRLGLGLYGYGYCHNDELQPVATLKTRIVQLRSRKAGEAIGYGGSEVLQRDSLIATIPVGYADGLDRHLSNGRWAMLVGGRKAVTVGRICMDSCMIDVTDIEGVAEGDEVSVFSPVAGNTPEDMAAVLGTIPYEIITSVAARVKRIYVRE
ncbi:MAG: alanine racemase [Rikenellaceae bacterium]|nr:alanine racemase [Rikenellaceae bacterium]